MHWSRTCQVETFPLMSEGTRAADWESRTSCFTGVCTCKGPSVPGEPAEKGTHRDCSVAASSCLGRTSVPALPICPASEEFLWLQRAHGVHDTASQRVWACIRVLRLKKRAVFGQQ